MFGLVCFTTNPTHPLMWAHYADCHRGILIEFDGSQPVFQTADFMSVEYDLNRIEFDPSEEDSGERVKMFVKRKSEDWRYEGEKRLVVPLSKTNKVELKKSACLPNGGTLHLLSISPQTISSVTYGLRTTDALRTEIGQLLRDSKFSHVKQFEMEADDFKYELKRNPI